jgi:uncharacterized RDD family membrane protein YckC
VAGTAAGAFRRLAAATYDGLLLLALLMVLTALALLFNHGGAITRASVGGFEYVYCASLVLCVAAYYGSAWRSRGQTLGMKAWDIRLEAASGALPSWRDVAVRLALAAPLYLLALTGLMLLIARHGGWLALVGCALPLALSYGWLGVTGRGTLHDLLSRTRLVRAPATAASAP